MYYNSQLQQKSKRTRAEITLSLNLRQFMVFEIPYIQTRSILITICQLLDSCFNRAAALPTMDHGFNYGNGREVQS